MRDGKRALELALQACGKDQAATGNDPGILDTLGAAYAEIGDYSKALKMARRALVVAQQRGNTSFVSALKREITK